MAIEDLHSETLERVDKLKDLFSLEDKNLIDEYLKDFDRHYESDYTVTYACKLDLEYIENILSKYESIKQVNDNTLGDLTMGIHDLIPNNVNKYIVTIKHYYIANGKLTGSEIDYRSLIMDAEVLDKVLNDYGSLDTESIHTYILKSYKEFYKDSNYNRRDNAKDFKNILKGSIITQPNRHSDSSKLNYLLDNIDKNSTNQLVALVNVKEDTDVYSDFMVVESYSLLPKIVLSELSDKIVYSVNAGSIYHIGKIRQYALCIDNKGVFLLSLDKNHKSVASYLSTNGIHMSSINNISYDKFIEMANNHDGISMRIIDIFNYEDKQFSQYKS